MKKTFYVSRRVIVPVDEYKNVHYEHGAGREYDHNEVEGLSVIESVEFAELAEEVDQAQRKMIQQDMGVTNLIIDKVRVMPLKKRLLKKAE